MRFRKKFSERYGPWAVITDASSAIGTAFARQLAAAGLSVVLTAPSQHQPRLHSLAAEILTKHPIDAKTISVDLSHGSAADSIIAQTAGLNVALLVCNAAGSGSPIYDASMFRDCFDKHRRMISASCSSPTALAHHFGRRFAEKGRGGILFVSSMACHPVPMRAMCSATGIYVSNLACSLRYELGRFGVTVMSLEPGDVWTEMEDGGQDAGSMDGDGMQIGARCQSADRCVTVALRSFYRGRMRKTPGVRNGIGMSVARALPMRLAIGMKGVLKGAGGQL